MTGQDAGRRGAQTTAGLSYGELLSLTEGRGTGIIYERIVAYVDAAVAEARREERAKADELRGLLWQAIRMYDGGGFVGDNVDRWFTNFIFHKTALGDDPNRPPAPCCGKPAPQCLCSHLYGGG